MGSALPARKLAQPGVGATFSRSLRRDGAPPHKRRPLYQLPKGKASACNADRLPAERGSASMNLGRRRTPPLPTLAISEQPPARGLRQFRPQARSKASESTSGPSKSSLFSRKKNILAQPGKQNRLPSAADSTVRRATWRRRTRKSKGTFVCNLAVLHAFCTQRYTHLWKKRGHAPFENKVHQSCRSFFSRNAEREHGCASILMD